MRRVLALDIGTSSVRATVYDERLTAHRSIQIRYRWHEPVPGHVELAPGRLLAHVACAMDELQATAPPRIDAVATAAFWHSLVGVDARGRPVTPVLPWSDRRAASEAVTLQAALDERDVHARTGCRLHTSYWPARLRWLRRHRRAEFRRIARWMSFPEWLERQWLGREGASVSQASATGLMDQATCEWDAAMLEASRIREAQLAPIVGPDAHAQLRPRLASRWPALARAIWIPAAGDGALNNVGAGCVRRERAAVMVGTSGAMRVLWTPRRGEPVRVPFGLWRYRLDRRRVLIGGALSNGGNAREWVLELTAGRRRNDPTVNRAAQDRLQRLADALPPDGHGLTVLPFLAGERSPDYPADARGVIHGLTLDTRGEHVLRAMMEAVAYRLAAIAGELQPGFRLREVVAAGGGLERSAAWTQILADTLGRPVRLCADAELTSRGAAAVALDQLGTLSLDDVEPPPGEVVRPDRARTRTYLRARQRQDVLYGQFARTTG
jgi:gluconokinase